MRARLDSGDLDAVDPGHWRKEAEIFVERELDCAISTPAEELVASSEMVSTAQYLCTIREDFCLAGFLPTVCLWRCQHKSYILDQELIRPRPGTKQKPSPSSPSQPPVRPPAAVQPLLRGHLGVLGPRTVAVLAVLEGGIGVLLEPIEPEADADARRRVKVAPRLPLLPQGEVFKFGIAERDIVQVQSFERHLQTPQYYFRTFQCVATPFVMTALVWFAVRMYLNDLYISIPDRLLVVAAMAQLLQNIPTEVSGER